MQKFERNRDWGTVQELKVEADTVQALRGAVMIAMVDGHKVTHFRVETITKEAVEDSFEDRITDNMIGANQLTLLWHQDEPTDNELPFELTTVDEITDFIVQWLEKKAQWPAEWPDTDGSIQAGFRAENSWSPFYTVIRITPTWIVYGK